MMAVAVENTFRVVVILIPENLLTTQKYESLACEKTIEPAPIANMANNLPVSDSRPRAGNIGATKEAAVMIATVDDPWAVLSKMQ